jgi:hypothetical protein
MTKFEVPKELLEVRLPAGDLEKLLKMADILDVTIGQLVRRAVNEFIENFADFDEHEIKNEEIVSSENMDPRQSNQATDAISQKDAPNRSRKIKEKNECKQGLKTIEVAPSIDDEDDDGCIFPF